jgi:hypothetical protein
MKCLIDAEPMSVYSGMKSYYKRGTAPSCQKSITITANNQEYTVPAVISTFVFNPAGEQPTDLDIIMENLTVGSNEITATSTCGNEAKNAVYTDVAKPDIDDIDDRTDQYATDLLTKQPPHAPYREENPVIKVISTDNTKNDITISMVTDYHRLAVVLENSNDSQYLLKMQIEKGEAHEVLLATPDFVGIGDQVVFIINNDEAKFDIDYTVRIKHFTKDSEEELVEIEIEDVIETFAAQNRTRLYYFTKSTYQTGDASATITWAPWETVNDNKTYE